MRTCSGCTLCCKLLPINDKADATIWEHLPQMVAVGLITGKEARETIKDFHKPAGERCPHQRHSKGCAIYNKRPFGCRFWSCAWLSNHQGTEKLSRPDRSHYVISPDIDYCEGDDERGHHTIPVIEIWVDPNYPDAHRDPELRAFLAKRGEEGYAALIRYDSHRGFLLIPPAMSETGEWFEKRADHKSGPSHTVEQKLAALGAHYKLEVR
jgi:Putative zinc- or iron-chelating domain